MTTFNDILGTSTDDAAQTIKQRYKLLSVRVHPDKGGTKALMQLVRHAYEQASAGKGHLPVNMPSTSGGDIGLERELKRYKKEKDELEALNALLKTQLAHAQKNVSSTSSGSVDYARKIAQLEGELVLVKDERNRLMNQKDAALAEQQKLAGDLRRALSDNEMLETELSKGSGLKTTAVSKWMQRIWLPAMATSALFAVVFLGVSSVNWGFVMAWFETPEPEPAAPPARVIYQEPESKTAALKAPPKPKDDAAKNKTVPMPFLQLKEVAGSWSLASYTGNSQPYISIRSANGSYIVNDCSGDFTLYLNEPYKPLRVAANLIYMHQNQHFHVYKIPYGQGSSPESWLQSRKLKINEEFYTSEAFNASHQALIARCNSAQS